MGFFDIFKRKKNNNTEFRTLIREYYGSNPFLFARSYAAKIYDIPEVRTAIENFADIFSSIPKYVERVNKNGNIEYFDNQTSRVLTLKSNPLQNATQFWKNAVTRLMLDNNVFIEPVWDVSGSLKSLYVLPKDNFKFNLENDRATVTFTGLNKTYNLSQLIYLNRFAEITGGTNNSLGLYETVIQSLAQQAINVASPNKVKAFLQGTKGSSPLLRKEDRAGTMEDFKLNMDENVQGVSYLDGNWTVMPINWQENDVNRELMQFVVNIVYNYFGITTEIINNKASEVEYQLFVRNKVEPLASQIEQEFTSKLFTQREIEHGNKIELDTFSLTVGTMQAKAQLFSVGLRQGVLNIDDAREMLGLPPLSDGLGKRFRVTGDTVDITIADKYQLGKVGVSNKKETSDEKANK